MIKFSEILTAWGNGHQIQYFVTTGYDSEWTDYTQNNPPKEQPWRLLWRIKP